MPYCFTLQSHACVILRNMLEWSHGMLRGQLDSRGLQHAHMCMLQYAYCFDDTDAYLHLLH